MGNDTLYGGSDNDRFVFNAYRSFDRNLIGIDTITDFEESLDRIVLDKTTFTALNSEAGSGFSDASEFAVIDRDSLVANSEALIVYNRITGNLFYNENGSSDGLGNGGVFADLIDSPSLVATSFIIQD